MAGVKKLVVGCAVLAAATLTACVKLPGTGFGPGNGNTGTTQHDIPVSPRQIAAIPVTLGGVAVGPAELARQNSLIGNNSAGIVGNNAAGIVGNNAAGFRLLALGFEDFIEDAMVYLTDPFDRFYKVGGQLVSTHTNGQGQYNFKYGVPEDQSVIVNVLLAKDQREVGFTVPKQGDNQVNVSIASTYVTEYLRYRAREDKKDMGDYDLTALSELTALTEKAMEARELATPSLYVGDIPQLTNRYALAVEKNVQGLGDAWRKVLGYRVLVGWAVAGNGLLGGSMSKKVATRTEMTVPKGLTMDADGNVYIVEETGHRIRKLAADGTIVGVAGAASGASGYEKHPDGTGVKGNDSPLNWPRSVTYGPDGNLYFGDIFNMRIRALCLKPATSFGVQMTEVGKIYDIVGDPDVGENQGQAQNGFANGFARRQGDVRGAKLAGPRGIAFDSDGNMVFSDTWGWWGTKGDPSASIWHHVRIVCNKPSTRYGVAMTQQNHVYTVAGKDWNVGFDGDEPRQAGDALIDYAQSVLIDSKDNIFFVDAGNYRVRKITPDGMISTVAGTGCWDQDGTGCAGISTGDGGAATAARLGSPYGIALDEKRGLMFVSEKSSNLVRKLDLQTGRINTIIGRDLGQPGGTTGDGIARMVYLNQPHDLLLDENGDLYVTSSRAHKVYKFLTSIL